MPRSLASRRRLASQLQRALEEFQQANATYARVITQAENRRRMRYSFRAASASLRKAERKLDRVLDSVLSKECLYLYNMKHVDAVLLLLEKINDHGSLRRVEIKCKDKSLAADMGRALLNHGFRGLYELPPARMA
ncbi:hypothetical protein NL676_017380 [Syzygium grande]|nr:hypothetical protein NL676_017380 [Syzygium grande]